MTTNDKPRRTLSLAITRSDDTPRSKPLRQSDLNRKRGTPAVAPSPVGRPSEETDAAPSGRWTVPRAPSGMAKPAISRGARPQTGDIGSQRREGRAGPRDESTWHKPGIKRDDAPHDRSRAPYRGGNETRAQAHDADHRPSGKREAYDTEPVRQRPRRESAEARADEGSRRARFAPADRPRHDRDDRSSRPTGRFDDKPRRVAASSQQRPPFGQHDARRDEARSDLPRLSKRMSELSLCSRREADEWIEQGWVRVDGKVVATLGTRIEPDARIDIDPAARRAQARRMTFLLHKPVGYVSAQAEDDHVPAVSLIDADSQWDEDRSGTRFSPTHLRGLAPAGRLDIDSTGLLVLTQDGRIARQLIGDDSLIEKEYLVRVVMDTPRGIVEQNVQSVFPPDQLELLRHGLELDGRPLKLAKVSWQNGEQLRVVLREGRKRQIRRMCELVGLRVVGLKRVRMGRIALGKLPPGQWRYLRWDEKF